MRECYKNDEASLYRMAQIVCRVINYCYLYNTYFRRHLDDAATKKITYRFKFLVNSLLLRVIYVKYCSFVPELNTDQSIQKKELQLSTSSSQGIIQVIPLTRIWLYHVTDYKHDAVAQGNHNINHIYHMHMSLS